MTKVKNQNLFWSIKWKALKEFSIRPNDAIYVGDTLYDYECAKSYIINDGK